MEKLLFLVRKLESLRGVPQFLFHSGIEPCTMLRVRKEVMHCGEDHDEIDFILNSPGGSPDDAYRIIKTLRSCYKVVNVVTPFWAKSAATLLSLGGNRIIMNEFSELGPLDMQLATPREDSFDLETESALVDEISLKTVEDRARKLFLSMFMDLHSDSRYPMPKKDLSKQLFQFLEGFYSPILKQINPYKIGKKKRKLDIGEHYATLILAQYHSDVNAAHLIDFLVNGCPDHGLVIDYDFVATFLPFVVKAETFGEEYREVLLKISFHLMDSYPDSRYIGFTSGALVNKSNIETENIGESLNHEPKKISA